MAPKYGSRQAEYLKSIYNKYDVGDITFGNFKTESSKFVRSCKCDCSDCGGKRWKGNCVIERLDTLKDELLIQGYETHKIANGLRGSTSSLSSNGSGIKVTIV